MKNKIFKRIRKQYLLLIKPLFSKKKVLCPFCNWSGEEFLEHGLKTRKNARCPKCGALERHRLYYLYLQKILPKDKNVKVLHFAPERILSDLFRSFENIDYISADLDSEKAMKQEDITKLSFADNTFDIIFCSHVLEHIEDDSKAMREVYRVLRPGGFAILQVPLGKGRKETFEDFSVRSPEEREKVFGQWDHVRIYGQDYIDRLKGAGFEVKIDDFYSALDDGSCTKYALKKEDIHLCQKNT